MQIGEDYSVRKPTVLLCLIYFLFVSFVVKFPDSVDDWLFIPTNIIVCIIQNNACPSLLAPRVDGKDWLAKELGTVNFLLNPIAIICIHSTWNYYNM